MGLQGGSSHSERSWPAVAFALIVDESDTVPHSSSSQSWEFGIERAF